MFSRVIQGTLICLLGGLLVLSGCQTKAGTGALVGGAGGAAVGGAIGSMSHARAGEGALIGGAIGALGGALVGNEMDKADKRKEEEEAAGYNHRDHDRRHSTAAVSGSAAQPGVTKYDVIDWSRRGLSDDIIIDRIERSGTIFRLTAADLNDLRDQGVRESVIRAMQETYHR